MKRYLLTAGYQYYPQSGDNDWVGMFDTAEEAERLIQRQTVHEYFSRGPRKGQVKSSKEVLKIRDIEIDWYEIIDLQNWSGGYMSRWNP